MLIAHSRPEGVTWSVSGTGAAITTTTAGIDDGRPDTLTGFTWITGTQNTSSIFRLRGDWTTGRVPRLVGFSNVRLPAGTKIKASFRRSTDSAGTYPYTPTMEADTVRIVEGPRGERTAWLVVKDGATAVVGVEFQIYNDVNGVASIVAAQAFQIGEAVVMAGDDTCPALGASIDAIDPTTTGWSWSNQPYAAPGVPYRQLQFALRTDSETEWLGTYATLLAKMDRGQTCAYVLRYKDRSGAFDSTLLHGYALLGIATRQPSMRHVARDTFDSGTITVVEAPIPA